MNSIERNLLVSRAIRRKLIGLGFDIRNVVNLNGFTGILYSQAFDWFRVEHGLHYSIEYGSTINKYSCDVYKTSDDLIELELNKITGLVEDIYSKDTYESARLACLEKLIELVTEKKG